MHNQIVQGCINKWMDESVKTEDECINIGLVDKPVDGKGDGQDG